MTQIEHNFHADVLATWSQVVVTKCHDLGHLVPSCWHEGPNFSGLAAKVPPGRTREKKNFFSTLCAFFSVEDWPHARGLAMQGPNEQS